MHYKRYVQNYDSIQIYFENIFLVSKKKNMYIYLIS